ncbi:heterogeneous nuclear ribonucleoprotein L-like isoform X2 [Crassostrea angulata]|uniref:heterogeneous nuclear ribonucleoprotein L-like isoform X2 n=1 Tax=Magallana angulata TaxID=2784310 RepID=UPI0022B0DAF6|nr:heterogeneous nuclear ribonucleoprotein L-like isoform X2 [Crassostrea angulata]
MASGYDGHVSKRQRRDNDENPLNPSPSQVVHVRGLAENILEQDLKDSVQHFGPVSYVVLMPRKHQALVEFEDISGATSCVNYAEENQIYVAGQPAYFNFSTSQRIQRPAGGEDHRGGNHILLFTVLNPQYPITVDVMHKICTAYGQVQRIVIFKKNGVQAMVEFDTVDTAKRAKQNLNGADIYSGCCTLKIDFAKPTRLNVFRNDNESWDYTQSSPEKDPANQRNGPLLADPRYTNAPIPYDGRSGAPPGPTPGYGGGPGPNQGYPPAGAPSGGYGGGGYGPSYGSGYEGDDGYGSPMSPRQQGYSNRGDRFSGNQGPPVQDRGGYGHPNMPAQGYQEQGPPPPGAMFQGSVIMVYGLNLDKISCDKLFNLFCLYGNVVRVKFLKSKEGSAMVQMGDAMAVDRCMQNLNYMTLFDNKITLGHSKQAFLQDVPNPYELPDGTPSFKDYMGSRNNRYANPEAASKNRILPPSKVLHFFNTPPNISEEQLGEVLENVGAAKPFKVKLFASKSDRSSSGLMQFESKSEALEALVLANHASIPNPAGKSPYVMKLCFSGGPIKE